MLLSSLGARDRTLFLRWALPDSSRLARAFWTILTNAGGAACTILAATLPFLAGGAFDQPPAPPEHRYDFRVRRLSGTTVYRDGICRWFEARPTAEDIRSVWVTASRGDDSASIGRPPIFARDGGGSSRSQTLRPPRSSE